MKRVAIDEAPMAVKEFVQSLPLDGGGVQLELGGHVVCTVVPAADRADRDARALLERGRELVRRSRERNKDIPTATVEREVRRAVNEVRQRKAQ